MRPLVSAREWSKIQDKMMLLMTDATKLALRSTPAVSAALEPMVNVILNALGTPKTEKEKESSPQEALPANIADFVTEDSIPTPWQPDLLKFTSTALADNAGMGLRDRRLAKIFVAFNERATALLHEQDALWEEKKQQQITEDLALEKQVHRDFQVLGESLVALNRALIRCFKFNGYPASAAEDLTVEYALAFPALHEAIKLYIRVPELLTLTTKLRAASVQRTLETVVRDANAVTGAPSNTEGVLDAIKGRKLQVAAGTVVTALALSVKLWWPYVAPYLPIPIK